ncbi:MAG: imidazoleglycerol-phosphate dehydratase [Planctomycetaceae bacterium]|nr:imidazoleglycerol-phosphate dehydratase [Planctomycetaceae bacterium]
MSRSASIDRKTAETDISLSLNIDGSGVADIETGIGFFDHMLTLLAKHSLMDLTVKAKGDIDVDFHHTVEDVGICFGLALSEALGDKAGITRYGSITLPMEETLATVAVDLSNRIAFAFHVEFPTEKIGEFDSQLVDVFWEAVANNGRINFHALLHYGRNSHHISEAVFKGAARAIRQAITVDPRQPGVPSSKGSL